MESISAWIIAPASAITQAVLTYWAAGVVHEAVHLLCALAVGLASACTVSNVTEALIRRRVHVSDAASQAAHLSPWRAATIRHGGWVGSLLLAGACDALGSASFLGGAPARAAAWVVAMEAIYSDLLSHKGDGWFHCGCFGLLLLSERHRDKVMEILQQMVRVTQMRGSQSGGLITFNKSLFGSEGVRTRVVNGKRGDLASKLIKAFSRDVWMSERSSGILKEDSGTKVFAGHTRFATTSKATLAGTHPHRWSPSVRHAVWQHFPGGGIQMTVKGVETFVCHNGDLDFYEVHGTTYPLEDVRDFVEAATGVPCPTPVDSVVIAGLIELLRTKGIWLLSLRYALLFRTAGRTLKSRAPSAANLAVVSDVFTQVFQSCLSTRKGRPTGWFSTPEGRSALSGAVLSRLNASQTAALLHLPEQDEETGTLAGLVSHTVDAFYDNDLLHSVREFLQYARGSFGLSVNCSLDVSREIVLAAKGQTMSVAFYPRSKLVLWGSEAAAVKAAMDLAPASIASVRDESMDAVRLDINDLQGEACLLRFPEAGEPAPPRWEDVVGAEDESQKTCRLMDGTLLVRVCCPEGERAGDIKPRLLKLEDNPLVLPLPPPVKDPVGHDINEIPAALNAVQKDWASSGSVNRLSACTLSRQVLRRLSELHAQGTQQNRSIDILVTGCEVSLWVGEQFAADLHRVFPRLTVRALSANKILGLLGHNYPVPQTGFKLEAENLDLTDSIVIIISHSGGTFAPLAISKLLQAVTNNIFVVTSEWDTQISRQLRSLESWAARSRIFSTGVGLRSAEPCSISLAATHQLLTQILLQLMLTVQSNHMALVTSGAAFIPDDLQQLARLNQDSISGIEEIVGVLRTGVVAPCSEVMLQLRALGGRWSQHVLEAPIAWILTAVYVIFTVTFSLPVATAVTTLIAGSDVYGAAVWRYFVMFADSLIFLFFPQLATWLIRLVQRRPLMHRMAHRTVVIGDIPWVAQSIEAFLSKLFASAYSNASVTVFSANPADHLVHRLTHRIARGTLLAVGRPDGRLSALSSAENAALLSVSQASSIQNLGHACCESLTIGHNAFKLPLSKFAVFLPSHRPRYICETDTVHGRGSDGSTVGPSASDTSQHLDSGPGAAIPSPPISPAGGMPAHRGPASPIRRHKSAGCAGPLENNSGRRDLKRDTPAILGFGHRVAGPKRSSENGCEHHNGQLSPGTSQRGASSSQLLGAFENIRKQDMKRDVSAVISSGQRLTHSNRSERSSGSERIRPLHGGRSRVEGHATPHANAGTGSSQKGIASGLLNIVHSRRSTERTRSQATAKHLSPQGGTPMDVKSTSIYVRHSMELISRAAVPSELTFVDEVRTAMQDRPELSTVSAQKQALLGMVEPSIEEVFGDNLMKTCPDAPIARLIIEQTLSCELYESRVASLQRLVAFFVMFHEMGKRVQDFWPRVSFGMLGYGMDRTHSVMRVATTASPVSAVEVNERIWELRLARAARKARDGFMRLLQADHSTDVLPP